MSTAWSSSVAPRLEQEHTSARWRRGAAISRTRSADAVRTLWNRIRWFPLTQFTSISGTPVASIYSNRARSRLMPPTDGLDVPRRRRRVRRSGAFPGLRFLWWLNLSRNRMMRGFLAPSPSPSVFTPARRGVHVLDLLVDLRTTIVQALEEDRKAVEAILARAP